MSRTKVWMFLTLGSIAYYAIIGVFGMAHLREALENIFAASYWSGATLIMHHMLGASSVSTDKS